MHNWTLVRSPNKKQLWNAICETQIKVNDERLRDARRWYESAYEWRLVTYAAHAQARLDAHHANEILFYISAVDKGDLKKADFDELRQEPNTSKTAKYMGLLVIFKGMEMLPTDSILPPHYVRGSPCKVIGLQLHENEPPIEGRDSLISHGCVLLKYMPKCVYVKFDDAVDTFLPEPDVSDSESLCMKGVIAIEPKPKQFQFKPSTAKNAISVTRTQIPLLPLKQCTLHGVQGKTAVPGFIVHWTSPLRITKPQKWLAHYASLSRPVSFATLLSHGLPDRDIIEGGPPEELLEAQKDLFGKKIAETKTAFAQARQQLGWPNIFPWNTWIPRLYMNAWLCSR